jgi:chromosome segregation ATPase
MSADKNHEQYLEEIEIAVAQTTKVLMEEHNSDLRKLAKVCAEKQLQVKRLKEFQENDRSTIHSLRAKLAEAIEEIECRNSTWETKEGEYEGEIAELKEELDIAHFEYDKLKEEKYSLYLKWSELKEEIEFMKNQLDVGGMMNFSKYND